MKIVKYLILMFLVIQGSSVVAQSDLRCDKTGLEDEVRLDWTGSASDYVIYGSGSAVDLMSPANEIGTTPELFWIDYPPVGGLYFYRVGADCADSLEPNETCGGYRSLGTIGSDEVRSYQPTLFAQGDVDVFRIDARETDSSCACCDGGFCFDEDYTLTVQLSVPATGGNYRLCATDQACSEITNNCITVGAGTTDSISILLDGACPGEDQYTIYAQVDSISGEADCSPYQLEFFFDALVCH